MKFIVYYHRREPGNPIPMQHREELVNEKAALTRAGAILDGGSDAPIHIADETGKVLLKEPEILRRLGRRR
jgi:hypothetical protein